MKHIDLTKQEEAIKQFFLALPADPEGSVVELNGKALARITPVDAAPPEKRNDGTEWSDLKNARRCELVDREIEGTLLPDDAAELADLQQQMLAERRRLAPVPLSELRRLHQVESEKCIIVTVDKTEK